MSDRIARRLVIRGRVQGVWFRESMRQQAQSLGVAGWVRNRADGTLEAFVEGTPQAIESILRWAHRGPEHAHVEHVQESEERASGLEGFEKRPTA
jgi:acylphosphatase